MNNTSNHRKRMNTEFMVVEGNNFSPLKQLEIWDSLHFTKADKFKISNFLIELFLLCISYATDKDTLNIKDSKFRSICNKVP